ncbi:MAG: PEFG-CTERM sorting domain-containing protein [Nitrosarchaeum sp.]|nr:PEFG-CTERM sorting domain-containing protein [Nitrosarchaeum sp.]
MNFLYLGVFTIFCVVGTLPISFGQSNNCPSCVHIAPEDIDLYKELFPITVWTDSKIYDHNSLVKVTGHLRPENNISPILAVVTSPIGNVVTVDQISADLNGDFSFILNTQSSLWKEDGDYIIKVQSGSDNRQFKTKFKLISYDVGSISDCTTTEIPITADNGGVYCIPFNSSKGTTINAEGSLKLETKTLSIQIRGQDIDSVILDIPRALLDSKSSSGMDSPFTVMSNQRMVLFEELNSTEETRQIKIDYSPTRNGSFQIIGTHVIPEFGSITLLVLLSAISAILLAGRLFSTRIVKL